MYIRSITGNNSLFLNRIITGHQEITISSLILMEEELH